MPTAEAEFPAAFDHEADYLHTLAASEQAFHDNLQAVVTLSDGKDLLVGNVTAYAQYGAPPEAETQHVQILRTTMDGNVTYAYAVIHVDCDGNEVGVPVRSSFFNGFGVDRLFDHTEDIGASAQFWAETTTFDYVEGVLLAPTITGENVVAEAAQQGVAAEGRAARRLGFLSKFRMPWPRRSNG